MSSPINRRRNASCSPALLRVIAVTRRRRHLRFYRWGSVKLGGRDRARGREKGGVTVAEEFPFFSSYSKEGIKERDSFLRQFPRKTKSVYLYTSICRVARPCPGNNPRGCRTVWTVRGAAALPSTRSPGTRSNRLPGSGRTPLFLARGRALSEIRSDGFFFFIYFVLS